MPITVTKCPIEGLFEIQPKVFGDARGAFFESWNERDFAEAGLSLRFVQDNQSRSVKGVLRGLHFQKMRPQGKLVRVVEGEVFDVAVDLRPGSKTYGKWHAVITSYSIHYTKLYDLVTKSHHPHPNITDVCQIPPESHAITDRFYLTRGVNMPNRAVIQPIGKIKNLPA